MSNSVTTGQGVRVGSTGWFVWNTGLWVVFFVLLRSEHLDDLAGSIRALPLPVEIFVWIVFFPWVAATAVWTSGWWDNFRLTFVALSVIVWTLIAIPRTKAPARAARRRPAR